MWPTMVRKQANNVTNGKRESELRPSLFDFDDDILLADDDEEATLAALMEADAVDQGAPQTRATRMRREMQALERWLVENEELHEREFGGADGVDDDDDGDEDRDHEHDGIGGDAPPPPPSVQVSASATPGVHAAPADDPWAASTTSNPTSTSTSTQPPTQSTALASQHSISITTPRSSGFDDDFSAFVSAPAVSIAGDTVATTATTSTPASTSASASEPIADARRLNTQTKSLLPSHTGGSIRSAMSDLSIPDTGDDLGVGGGYEALDDTDDVDIEDGDPRPSTSGQRSDDRAAGLGDGPFDLPNILNALQTIREDVAGIEDEAERRATTARFASEFVYKKEWARMMETGRKQTVDTVLYVLLPQVLIYIKHLCVLLLHLRLIIVCIVLLISFPSLISYPTLGKVQDTGHVQCLDCVLCLAHWHVPKDLVHSRQLICLECFLQVLRELAEKVPA